MVKIIFKEKYEPSGLEVIYSQLSEKYMVTPLHNNKSRFSSIRHNFVWALFSQIFLPEGFPRSVSADYINYQIWDTAQAFCSTITGILASKEVLRGVGVGDEAATPLAATIMWVVKDSCGHLGRICFAWSHGSQLDAYSKKWRLYADVLNDAAMCLEMFLPLGSKYITVVLCSTTVMRAIVGVAGGATRAALTQHHAIRGNMADVSAKDSAQETAVNLVASLFALLIMYFDWLPLPIFFILIALHIMCNYYAVRSVCLNTLNEPRLIKCLEEFCCNSTLPKPTRVNGIEPIIYPNSLAYETCGFKIKLGASLQSFLKNHSYKYEHDNLKIDNEKQKYVIFPDVAQRTMLVSLKDSVTVEGLLNSYIHAFILACMYSEKNNFKTAFNRKPKILNDLKGDWLWEEINSNTSKKLYTLNYTSMQELNMNLSPKILSMIATLRTSGWDLSKSLLNDEQWRIILE